MTKNKITGTITNNLILISITLVILGISLFFSIAFGWFANNKKVNATGMSVSVADNIELAFEKEVVAVRHSLTGYSTTNTYKKSLDNSLVLIDSVSTDPNYDEPKENSFIFDELLPGEYVDITINYYAKKEVNSDYSVSFASFDFSEGVFTIKDVTYSVLGAFKYKPLSIEYFDEDGESVESSDYTNDYVWLETYVAGKDSSISNSIELYNGFWLPEYKRASFTFRVYEDFSQYYRLINAIGESVPNQLSQKTLKIGQIRIEKEED